jgi:hypothetical protein
MTEFVKNNKKLARKIVGETHGPSWQEIVRLFNCNPDDPVVIDSVIRSGLLRWVEQKLVMNIPTASELVKLGVK